MSVTKVKIPLNVRKYWKSIFSHGEIQLIADASEELSGKKISRNTVSNAISNGNCEQETFETIKIYVFKKLQKEKELTKDTLR